MTRAEIRTCVGCRRRAMAAELLRVVVDSSQRPEPGSTVQVVVPDPRRRAPGRGAWLHPVTECVARAERRKAFGRALRIATPVDATPVRRYVELLTEKSKEHEHPMKRQP
jgi:predicted RNA-binding protein YlxR (DUF448 family)